MAFPADQLLSSLGSGVRPFDAVETAPLGVTATEDFGALLDRARSGNPNTGLGVRLTNELEGVLAIEQRRALAAAVDRVAVVGGESALILLDGRTLRVDVRTRTVLEELAVSDTDPVVGIDVFAHAGQADGQSPISEISAEPAGLNGSARVVRNASLVRALSGDAPRTA